MTKPAFKDVMRARPAELRVIHPVYGDQGAVLYLTGSHAPQYKHAHLELLRSLGPDVDWDTMPIEERMRHLAPLFASCVTGWNEVVEEALGPWSKELALSLFTDPELAWIGDQVAGFVTEASNFFRPAPAPLVPLGSPSDK